MRWRMTSKRELMDRLESLDVDDGGLRVEFTHTYVGSGWNPDNDVEYDGLDEGDAVTETEVIELEGES